MQLVISNNSASSPQTLDLSAFVRVSDGEGLDPAASSFTQRVFQRSLLKAGATLALTQYTERELQFPLRLKSTTSSGCVAISQQIAQIVETPGATVTWQDDGLSAATTWDLVVGTWEVQYRFREAQQHFLSGLLRLFAQPFGRTAGPRPYAAASGVGPLLMISPYASTGALAIGASTQAGVAGFGGQQQGASSGVFYPGSPSLAGDALAQLQISYVGPLPNTATNAGTVPYVAVSLLPDANYRPLIPAPEITTINSSRITAAGAVASQYLSIGTGPSSNPQDVLIFTPLRPDIGAGGNAPITAQWTGQHRLLVIARASGAGAAQITAQPNTLVPFPTSASVTTADWGLYDLGTFALRGSAYPLSDGAIYVGLNKPPGAAALDVMAFAMLPDNTTWFLNPTGIQASQFGYPKSIAQFVPNLPYTNTLLLDDAIGDQFMYHGASQTSAPSPLGTTSLGAPMINDSNRITPYSRGLVPRPDPRNGLPIIAILGVGQSYTPSGSYQSLSVAQSIPGASWANPQSKPTYAQVSVVERFRYVAP